VTDRAALVRELAAVPTRLVDTARRTPEPPPGEWAAREVVCHLVAVETEAWHARLDMLWERDDEPAWPWTEPGPWAGEGSETLEGALEAFEVRRAATLDRLARLDDAGWRRTGVHQTYGRLDVTALIELALDHDREHLASLAAALD
jgi:hypothetical protein